MVHPEQQRCQAEYPAQILLDFRMPPRHSNSSPDPHIHTRIQQIQDITMSLLPPGQSETRKFPSVGETAPPTSMTPDNWRLIVEGELEAPFELTYREFLVLPQQTLLMDVHCVTGWSHFGMTFEGVPLATLLERAQPRPVARFVRFLAYSGRGHDTSLPLDLAREQCWLVHRADGAPLTPEHGGPLRVVTPGK